MATCKHCKRQIEGIIHVEGEHWHKSRCWPADSGLPYGYNADPEGAECSPGCLGYTRTG